MKTTMFNKVMGKSIVVSGLAALFLVITMGQSMASGKASIYTKQNTNLSIISVVNPGVQPMSLYIENAAGDILYYNESAIEGQGFSKAFDFSRLNDGSYNLRVISGKEELEQAFAIAGGKAEMERASFKAKPFFRFNDELLSLSYLNFGEENLKVYLYDNDNTLVHQEDLGKDVSVSRQFSFSKVLPGKYEVILTAGNKTFTYNLDK